MGWGSILESGPQVAVVAELSGPPLSVGEWVAAALLTWGSMGLLVGTAWATVLYAERTGHWWLAALMGLLVASALASPAIQDVAEALRANR